MSDDEVINVVDENDIVVKTELRKKVYGDGLEKNQYIRYVNI